MITFKKFLKAIKYKIQYSSKYQWECYGDRAHAFDYENDSLTASAIVDLKDHTVYEVIVSNYDLGVSFRIIHPKYRKKYNKEAKQRGINPNEAWDGVKYHDVPEDSMLIILKQLELDKQNRI